MKAEQAGIEDITTIATEIANSRRRQVNGHETELQSYILHFRNLEQVLNIFTPSILEDIQGAKILVLAERYIIFEKRNFDKVTILVHAQQTWIQHQI